VTVIVLTVTSVTAQRALLKSAGSVWTSFRRITRSARIANRRVVRNHPQNRRTGDRAGRGWGPPPRLHAHIAMTRSPTWWRSVRQVARQDLGEAVVADRSARRGPGGGSKFPPPVAGQKVLWRIATAHCHLPVVWDQPAHAARSAGRTKPHVTELCQALRTTDTVYAGTTTTVRYSATSH